MRFLQVFFVLFLASTFIYAAYPKPETSATGMVTSAHRKATEAGLQMLKAGGNAIDAAVATTFAISVVEPFSAGIGGGGFLLFFDEPQKKTYSLDFRERAPHAASKNMYLDQSGKANADASMNGYLSVAVPGTVAGLFEAHRRFGKLPWSHVLKPAIRLARKGFAIDWTFVHQFADREAILRRNPAAWSTFTKNGKPFRAGDTLTQLDLAKTLSSISKNPHTFYRGWIAQAIVKDMQRHGGILTLEDFRRYQTKWRDPICNDFLQTQICSIAPPSSGGVILAEMLNMLAPFATTFAWHDVDTLEKVARAMKTAYEDRSKYLGDPDFVNVPSAKMITKEFALKRWRESFSSSQKTVDLRRESQETSHLTVVDRNRNAVSLTFTINYGFGSGVVAQGTGILLNDEMDDFAAAPNAPNAYGLIQGEANSIAPEKTPLSSMTPFIALQNGSLRMAGGTPGGSRITTMALQMLLNVLVLGMDASQAVSTPRIHHQWRPDQLQVERHGLDPLTVGELKRRGYDIDIRDAWGNANLIVVKPDGSLEGAADPRGSGVALGQS